MDSASFIKYVNNKKELEKDRKNVISKLEIIMKEIDKNPLSYQEFLSGVYKLGFQFNNLSRYPLLPLTKLLDFEKAYLKDNVKNAYNPEKVLEKFDNYFRDFFDKVILKEILRPKKDNLPFIGESVDDDDIDEAANYFLVNFKDINHLENEFKSYLKEIKDVVNVDLKELQREDIIKLEKAIFKDYISKFFPLSKGDFKSVLKNLATDYIGKDTEQITREKSGRDILNNISALDGVKNNYKYGFLSAGLILEFNDYIERYTKFKKKVKNKEIPSPSRTASLLSEKFKEFFSNILLIKKDGVPLLFQESDKVYSLINSAGLEQFKSEFDKVWKSVTGEENKYEQMNEELNKEFKKALNMINLIYDIPKDAGKLWLEFVLDNGYFHDIKVRDFILNKLIENAGNDIQLKDNVSTFVKHKQLINRIDSEYYGKTLKDLNNDLYKHISSDFDMLSLLSKDKQIVNYFKVMLVRSLTKEDIEDLFKKEIEKEIERRIKSEITIREGTPDEIILSNEFKEYLKNDKYKDNKYIEDRYNSLKSKLEPLDFLLGLNNNLLNKKIKKISDKLIDNLANGNSKEEIVVVFRKKIEEHNKSLASMGLNTFEYYLKKGDNLKTLADAIRAKKEASKNNIDDSDFESLLEALNITSNKINDYVKMQINRKVKRDEELRKELYDKSGITLDNKIDLISRYDKDFVNKKKEGYKKVIFNNILEELLADRMSDDVFNGKGLINALKEKVYASNKNNLRSLLGSCTFALDSSRKILNFEGDEVVGFKETVFKKSLKSLIKERGINYDLVEYGLKIIHNQRDERPNMLSKINLDLYNEAINIIMGYFGGTDLISYAAEEQLNRLLKYFPGKKVNKDNSEELKNLLIIPHEDKEFFNNIKEYIDFIKDELRNNLLGVDFEKVGRGTLYYSVINGLHNVANSVKGKIMGIIEKIISNNTEDVNESAVIEVLKRKLDEDPFLKKFADDKSFNDFMNFFIKEALTKKKEGESYQDLLKKSFNESILLYKNNLMFKEAVNLIARDESYHSFYNFSDFDVFYSELFSKINNFYKNGERLGELFNDILSWKKISPDVLKEGLYDILTNYYNSLLNEQVNVLSEQIDYYKLINSDLKNEKEDLLKEIKDKREEIINKIQKSLDVVVKDFIKSYGGNNILSLYTITDNGLDELLGKVKIDFIPFNELKQKLPSYFVMNNTVEKKLDSIIETYKVRLLASQVNRPSKDKDIKKIGKQLGLNYKQLKKFVKEMKIKEVSDEENTFPIDINNIKNEKLFKKFLRDLLRNYELKFEEVRNGNKLAKLIFNEEVIKDEKSVNDFLLSKFNDKFLLWYTSLQEVSQGKVESLQKLVKYVKGKSHDELLEYIGSLKVLASNTNNDKFSSNEKLKEISQKWKWKDFEEGLHKKQELNLELVSQINHLRYALEGLKGVVPNMSLPRKKKIILSLDLLEKTKNNFEKLKKR